jgi:hypothetical protein
MASRQPAIVKMIMAIPLLLCCQLLAAPALYGMTFLLWERWVSTPAGSIGWGITVFYSSFAYGIISLVCCVALSMVQQVKTSVWVLASGYIMFLILFLLLFGRGFSYHPYRSLLLLGCTFAGYVLSFYAKKLLLGIADR